MKVGLLDADIYGPSQALLLGTKPENGLEVVDELLQPVLAHGLACMSISFIKSDRTPAIWRGPMASGAIQQLLLQTNWGDLDVLVVDLPPGTGDIQLTLSQKVRLSGAIVVTTPQEIALLDARKGIEMFRRVSIPLIGVIENMSHYICSGCGHKDNVYGMGGGQAISEEYEIPLLGELPLMTEIREFSDKGEPIVSRDSGSPASQIFFDIAGATEKFLMDSKISVPEIKVIDD